MGEEIKKAFPLKRLKLMLGNSERNYTDEQMIEIRDFLIEWANINYPIFKRSEELDKLKRESRKKNLKQFSTVLYH